MKKRNLLFSALLAVSVASVQSLAADVETLSDDALEEVSAQGYQQIEANPEGYGNIIESGYVDYYEKGAINNQDNNLDSVQLNGNAQANASVQGLVNSGNSANNQNANLLDIKTNNSSGISQEITQETMNHVNSSDGDYAIAGNINKETQRVGFGDLTTSITASGHLEPYHIKNMDNNNNSVQLNDNAQKKASGVNLVNTAASSANQGYNILSADKIVSNTSQYNNQSAESFNNTASGSTAAAAINAELGGSVDISSINSVDDFKNAITETNGVQTQFVDMRYGNHFENRVGSGKVDPGDINVVATVENNNNNNNSVQLNDDAQKKATSLFISNISVTAANTGGNMIDVDSIRNSELSQTNEQYAANHNNIADGDVAIAANLNKETQNISNMPFKDYERDVALIKSQNNNNNSVQLNDNAQKKATGISITNAALSGVNTGSNIIGLNTVTRGSTVSQSNSQLATNFNNAATGNEAWAGNGEFQKITYGNRHVREAPGQSVHTVHATVMLQNNNNNSVQLNDNAQAEANVGTLSNVANSALNMGVNLLSLNSVSNSSIEQTNDQTAENHSNSASGVDFAFAGNLNKETQYIYNCKCSDIKGTQNNNNNSVQLNGNAQNNLNGLLVVNAANSAVNSGLNLIHTGANVSGSTVTQANLSTANNWNNTATASGMAIAGNAEMFRF